MVQVNNFFMVALLAAAASSALPMQKRLGQTIARSTLISSSGTQVGLRSLIASRDATDQLLNATMPVDYTNTSSLSSVNGTTTDDSVPPPGGDPSKGGVKFIDMPSRLGDSPMNTTMGCHTSVVPSQFTDTTETTEPSTNTTDPNLLLQLASLLGNGTGTSNTTNTSISSNSTNTTNTVIDLLSSLVSLLFGNGTGLSTGNSHTSISSQLTGLEGTTSPSNLTNLFSNGTDPSVSNSSATTLLSGLLGSNNTTTTAIPTSSDVTSPGSILRRQRAAMPDANIAKSNRVQYGSGSKRPKSGPKPKRAKVFPGEAKVKFRRRSKEVKPGYVKAEPARTRPKAESKPVNARL